MFKLAAVTAVVAAGSGKFADTAEMFQIELREKQFKGLEEHARDFEESAKDYELKLLESPHGKQFKEEVKAVMHTPQFVRLGEYVEAMHKRGPTPQIKKFRLEYQNQVHKVQALAMKLDRQAYENTRVVGEDPHERAIVNVDNDLWYQFNMEYYKLREMQYYAQQKIPEVVALRKNVSAVRYTREFAQLLKHWKEITQTKEHRKLHMKFHNLIYRVAENFHMSKKDQMQLSPAHSPVMFDAWHAVCVTWMAMGRGDLNPMLDWIIDGKYNDWYVKRVKPEIPTPENYPEDLYLF